MSELLIGDNVQVLLVKSSTDTQYYEPSYCSGTANFNLTRKEKRIWRQNVSSIITDKKGTINIDSMLVDTTNNKVLDWFEDSDLQIILNFFDEDEVAQYTRTLTNIEFDAYTIEWKEKSLCSLKFNGNFRWS